MKRFLSISLIIGILLSTLSIIGVSVYAKQESDGLQAFIDDTIELINQNDGFSNEYSRIKMAEETKTDGGFESCRLIIESKKAPDKLNSIGITSGFEDYFIVQFENEYDTEIAFNYYKKQKSILSVYPDEVISLSEFEINETTTNKSNVTPDRLNSWGGDLTGLYDLKKYLTDNSVSMDKVVVAVVDTGIDLEHEFLQNRFKKTNFNSSGSGDPNSEMDKINGHGTMVSSVIIDSTSSNVIVAGYKVMNDEGVLTELSASLGILQAIEDGVDIVNASFQSNRNEGLMADVLKRAYEENVLVVAAAGNTADCVEIAERYPAQSFYCLTVASIDTRCLPSTFSSYGRSVDISAPGEDIPVAYPNNRYMLTSGTSLSAPYVSASCALLKALNSNSTANEIKDRIKEKAMHYDEIVSADPKVLSLYGVGILDSIASVDMNRQTKIKSNINPGDYFETIDIELESEGAEEIYYTLDQTTPTKDNGILYEKPIEISGDGFVVKAIAYSKYNLRSETFSGYYRSWLEESEDMFKVDESGKILSYSGEAYMLSIPKVVNGVVVTDIANGVFDKSRANAIMLPETITTLTGGFYENKTVSYIYGENVTEIGDYVFRRSNVSAVDFPNLEKIGWYSFGSTPCLISVSFPKLKITGSYAFHNSLLRYVYLPELESAGEGTFAYCRSLIEVHIPKLQRYATLSIMGSGWFSDTNLTMALDLPLLENVTKKDFRSEQERYLRRIEFSNLKELGGLPTSTLSSAEYTLVLPSTINSITINNEIINKGTYIIYGSAGTIVEQWANENGFKFIEITPETAVITDLPEYYKSYMGELEADVVGFNRQYQWFANTINSNEGGIPIEGAINKTFNPLDYPAAYYYCVVTSTDKGFKPVEIKTSACENRAAVADYSKVNEVLAKVPDDLSIYSDESRLNLENAINAVEKNLYISQQTQVDAMASAIESAIDSLKTVTIKLSESHIELKKNEKHTITAESESKVQWSSDNPDVAIVDEKGVVTAVGKGTALITATTETGASDSCVVEVNLTLCQWLVYVLKLIIDFIVKTVFVCFKL